MRLINADAIIYKKSKFDTTVRSPYDMSLYHEKRTLEWVAKEDIDEMPTIEAEPVQPVEFEWCYDCKEYDQNAHCCHRWTKVIRNTVNDLKTQGYEPIKHGKWIYKECEGIGYYVCSECGHANWLKEDNYCSCCGTKMDSNNSNALNALEMNEVNDETK